MSEELPKNGITRIMIDFDGTATIVKEWGGLGHINCHLI